MLRKVIENNMEYGFEDFDVGDIVMTPNGQGDIIGKGNDGRDFIIVDLDNDGQKKFYISDIFESVQQEAKWSNSVSTKWHPAEGLFKSGSAEKIASSALSGHGGDAGKAIKAVEFYLNRGGKNLSDERKGVLKHAVEILQKKEKKESAHPRFKKVVTESIEDIDLSNYLYSKGIKAKPYKDRMGNTYVEIPTDNATYRVRIAMVSNF